MAAAMTIAVAAAATSKFNVPPQVKDIKSPGTRSNAATAITTRIRNGFLFCIVDVPLVVAFPDIVDISGQDRNSLRYFPPFTDRNCLAIYRTP